MRTNRLTALLGTAVLAAVLAGCTSSSNDDPPAGPASTPTVVVNTINGTGCPTGTPGAATATVTPDGTAVHIEYAAAMTAKTGPGVPPTAFRVACQVNITATWAGHTYGVAGAHHGSMSIPAGTTATQRTTYYVTAAGAPVDHVTAGPSSGAYNVTDPGALAVPCGTTTNLNVKTDLRVTTGAAATFTLDGAAPAGTDLTLTWSAC